MSGGVPSVGRGLNNVPIPAWIGEKLLGDSAAGPGPAGGYVVSQHCLGFGWDCFLEANGYVFEKWALWGAAESWA